MNKIQSALGWIIGKTLPVKKNKIVVSSYYGRGYSDSPKAIVDELLKSDRSLDIVWLTDDITSLPNGVRGVPYNSIRRMLELSSAKIWIDNCRKGAKYKKTSQYYMQVWHGFALKQIEKDVIDKLPDANYEQYAKRDSSQIDVIVSNSSHMTKVYKNSFWYQGDIQQFGSPRNDVFFKSNTDLRRKVRTALNIDENTNIVLYAPTFRVSQSLEPYQMDTNAICKSLSHRFGGLWVFVTRLHPNIAKLASQLDYKDSVDATEYDDIQELLVASDVLISDYSSVLFDFMLTKKPCFMYATDIEDYRNDRNFYISLDEMPFPISVDNTSFCKAIENFDETSYNDSIKSFKNNYGFNEDGNASKRCAEWIFNRMED